MNDNSVDVEAVAISRCEKHMNELQEKHSDWYESFEDTMPDSASRAEIVALMNSAPTNFAWGLMYGKFTMRLEIEAITGRAFK